MKNSYSLGKVSGKINVGGLVGYVNGGDVDSSYHTNEDVLGESEVGGLVGSLYFSSSSKALIYDSYVAAYSVSGSGDYVGGIAGKALYLERTHFVGKEVEGVNKVGGLVGFGNSIGARVYDSYVAECSVSGSGNYVGGIAGKALYLERTHFVGKEVKGVNYVGGLGGSVEKRL